MKVSGATAEIKLKSTVGIAIVNYKTADLTIECLRSLDTESQSSDFEVIVVDNDSQDNSFELLSKTIITEGWKDWVNVRQADYNGGFAYGNNIAIRQFMQKKKQPEFILLLNPDTIVLTDAIKNLASFMLEHSKVGIAGSRIEDVDGIPLHSSFKFHSWITELNRGFSLGLVTRLLKPWLSSELISDQAEKTDWVSGASMMIRSSVLQQIGGLDEAYFMYYEETDFCINAMRSGWECWYIPSSRVVHYVGKSSGINNAGMKKRMPAYWFDSRRRYFLKNHGIIHAILADFCWLIGLSSWKLRNLIQRKPDHYPLCFLADAIKNSTFFKGFRLLQVKKTSYDKP